MEQSKFSEVAVRKCLDCGGTRKVDSMTEIGVIGGYLDCSRCQGTGYLYSWLWTKCDIKHYYHNPDVDIGYHLAWCKEVGCIGYMLIEGEANRWVALAKVAITLPRAIIITPHSWDSILPDTWIKFADFDVEALATVLVDILEGTSASST